MDFTGQIGYVGTRSTRQLGLVDINAGQVIGAGDDGKPLETQFGRTASTVFVQPVGKGRYNSLQAQVQRRFAGGLSLGVNYTWSKAMSDNENSSWFLADNKTQALAYMSRNYALTSTDRTHNVGITNVWELPFGPGRHWVNDGGVLSHIVGGWQVNNLISIMSGTSVQRARGRYVAQPARQHPDGGPGEADRGEARRSWSRHALLRSDGVRRGDRGTVRQHRLLLPARAWSVQLGLRADARVHPDPPSDCSSASRRSTSRTRPTSRTPTTTSATEEFMTITETAGSRTRGDRRAAVPAGVPRAVLSHARRSG